MAMKVAVPREITPVERRVAIIPSAVGRLTQAGFAVLVESRAGEGALFSDEAYREAGAEIVADAAALYETADVVLKVQQPAMNDALGAHEIDLLREDAALIAFLHPLRNPELVRQLAGRGVTSFSLDAVPRIARAQSMDALTSMASIAGYKAALIAANSLGRMLPMMITAAGTLAPAKGLVLGAGVAGLQAIATGRRLGAVMHAYDVRPIVKEQVESLGAKFIDASSDAVATDTEDTGGYAKELSSLQERSERELIHRQIQDMDFVITTAAVPGRPAPVLVTKEMVMDMRAASVIVDIAAEMGGNCELTRPGEETVHHGVIIHGPINLPSSMPIHASQMYSRNISNLLLHLVKDGKMDLDFEDEITKGCTITHGGRIVHEATLAAGSPEPQQTDAWKQPG